MGMEINRIASQPMGMNNTKQAVEDSTNKGNGSHSFGEIFSNYLNGVNNQLLDSEKLTAQLSTGEVKNLHEVTIAAQKASISLQLTVQVRDKAMEAYQEVMRMQI